MGESKLIEIRVAPVFKPILHQDIYLYEATRFTYDASLSLTNGKDSWLWKVIDGTVIGVYFGIPGNIGDRLSDYLRYSPECGLSVRPERHTDIPLIYKIRFRADDLDLMHRIGTIWGHAGDIAGLLNLCTLKADAPTRQSWHYE